MSRGWWLVLDKLRTSGGQTCDSQKTRPRALRARIASGGRALHLAAGRTTNGSTLHQDDVVPYKPKIGDLLADRGGQRRGGTVLSPRPRSRPPRRRCGVLKGDRPSRRTPARPSTAHSRSCGWYSDRGSRLGPSRGRRRRARPARDTRDRRCAATRRRSPRPCAHGLGSNPASPRGQPGGFLRRDGRAAAGRLRRRSAGGGRAGARRS